MRAACAVPLQSTSGQTDQWTGWCVGRAGPRRVAQRSPSGQTIPPGPARRASEQPDADAHRAGPAEGAPSSPPRLLPTLARRAQGPRGALPGSGPAAGRPGCLTAARPGAQAVEPGLITAGLRKARFHRRSGLPPAGAPGPANLQANYRMVLIGFIWITRQQKCARLVSLECEVSRWENP